MKNIKIVHLCKDEKWTGGAYQLFEKAFPGMNEYLVIKPTMKTKALKHISYIESLTSLSFKKLEKEQAHYFNNASLVVLHGLQNYHARIAKRIINKKNILWLIIGVDMYQNPFIFKQPILGPKTSSLKNKLENNMKSRFRNILKSIFRLHLNFERKIHRIAAKTAKNIDFVATFQKEQFELLKNSHAIAKDAKLLHFSFYPIEQIIDIEDESLNILGKNILLGNSAYYTNNHLEAIDKLTHFNLEDKKVYTPLNYGLHKYSLEIMRYGKQKLGNNFYPLKEFLPLYEYNKILQSCGNIIMNHHRGQAAGNVLSSLYRGSKLFMSEQSPIYKYLKRVGCYVYSVEHDLNPGDEDTLKHLDKEKIKHNRKQIQKEISEEVLVDSLKKGINDYLTKAG